jgi:tetratricopeptide (TPR) repeat protein
VRKNHDTGLVHYEVHFNNTIFFDNSVTIADWEEGSHRCNLTREQFLDGIVADLVRLVERCCSEERVYRQYYERLLQHTRGRIPVFEAVNYFMHYFREDEVNQDEKEGLQTLQEKPLKESEEKVDLIEKFVGKLVLTIFGKGHFGKGIDWKDMARPFMSGFSDDEPKWQAEATTTFDPKLFVQKGEWPYGRKKKQPTKTIGRAEEAIYESRFEDAIKIYENILGYAEGTAPKVRDADLFGTSRLLRDRHRRKRDFDSYIHNNLASLYFALRQDKEAKRHFEIKIFP